MDSLRQYSDAIDFLYRLQWFGFKPGLETTFKLSECLGNPHEKLRFIHLAGTNGKGSTCAMLENIYRQAGLRVGLYTSPHLVRFNERIQINRRPIADGDLVASVSQMEKILSGFSSGQDPTLFEVTSVMALKYFHDQHCDLVIWETGLGGRLDATNIVTPLASVITNIQKDHEKWLGETLEKIAMEKAGIIKKGVPVVTSVEEPEALKIISQKAASLSAPLMGITHEDAKRGLLKNLVLPLPGAHQRINAALAIATVRILQSQFLVGDETIRSGLRTVNWPGRFQKVERPCQTVILDGAHNPDAARWLKETFHAEYPARKPAIILGIMKDKDWKAVCSILAPLAEKMILIPVASARTADPAELSKACREANPAVIPSLAGSMSEALKLTANDPLLLITGSFYLVGEAAEKFHLMPSEHGAESALNEWFSDLK